MKKINFCKATTIILIINVILSIVLFFVVPDKIAIQWVVLPFSVGSITSFKII